MFSRNNPSYTKNEASTWRNMHYDKGDQGSGQSTSKKYLRQVEAKYFNNLSTEVWEFLVSEGVQVTTRL